MRLDVKYFLSLAFYRVLLFLLLPILILVLVVRSKNHSEYRQRLSERLGFVDKSLKQQGIVVHAASVGEVIALKTFIEKLLISQPNTPITITTFTPTGSAQVKKLFADNVQHCYLPIDCFVCTWLFMYRLKPKVMVFMETEIWPNLIAQCHTRQCKLLLINGRLSAKSMKSYKKISGLISPSLQAFDQILTQSQVNQDNFIALGGSVLNCELSGNVKFDISITPSIINKQAELQQLIIGERKLWVIASTHAGDEQLILNSFKHLYKQHPELLLVIVPRHPERFNEVAKLCIKQGFNTCKRSENRPVDLNKHVWVLDTLGELMPMCALATIVTIGGSFSQIGGHNPLEPALFKKPVIVGADMKNFTEVMQQLTTANGVIQLNNETDLINLAKVLTKRVDELLINKNKRTTLGENAYQVVLQNQGASDRTLAHLESILNDNGYKQR